MFNELKAITGKLVPDSKKIDKAIKKDAKQLAKKISRELIIDEVALVAASDQQKNTAAEAPKADQTKQTALTEKSINGAKLQVKSPIVKTAKKAVKA